jgi:hypothetical protein
MFEGKRSGGGLKIVLPPLQHRPVSQQVLKRPKENIPSRPQTVGFVPILTPLDRLKALRKIRKLQKVYYGNLF